MFDPVHQSFGQRQTGRQPGESQGLQKFSLIRADGRYPPPVCKQEAVPSRCGLLFFAFFRTKGKEELLLIFFLYDML